MTDSLDRSSGPAPAGRPWWQLALPLLILCLLIGGTGLYSHRSLSDEIRRETHRTLAVIAEQKRQQIEGWLAESRVDTRLYFSSHSQLELLFTRWLDSGRRDTAALQRMQLLMQEAARLRGWAGLSVLDADGRPVTTVGEADAQALGALVHDVLQRPRIALVDLHRSASGVVYHGMLAPIGAPGAPPRGVAYLSWKADQVLYPLVESWPVPTQTAETYLVRRDGAEVRFLTPLRHRHDTALALARPVSTPDLPAARAVQGERGILAGGRDYRSVPVLAYASAVAGTPWLMLAEIDEVEAYAGVRSAAWNTALVLGLGLLLVCAGGYLLWRRDRQHRALAALQAQRAAEARFRVVFEQAPLGVALVDSRSGCIIEANARFGQIVGRSPEALAGMDPMDFTHPDDVAETQALSARLGSGEGPVLHLNKRYRHADGTIVWASVTGARVQGGADEAPRTLAIVEDITARRQMEQRLQLSEARHRLLADNAIDVILTMDLAGRCAYVSPSVHKLRGYTADEAMAQGLDQLLAAESLPVVVGYLDRLRADLAAGQPPVHFRGELEVRCRDGSTVWVEATASPLLGADGSVVEILGVIRDISDRRRHERELRQATDAAESANAAKSEFLAHMSHEIRTPMNAVLGLAQVLAREPLAAGQREMVERIRSAGQSLLALLNDVLDLSKIEAGQLRIEPRPFDLGRLLANLDSLMGQVARSKGLALRLAPPVSPLGPLLGDGLRLEQVLFNLVGNAIKFTEHGEVAIHVAVLQADASAVRLRFEVRDTGIGIAAHALARLFAPFTQADAAIGLRFGGTGLGLSICKRLVELMGGTIGADSQPGRGSTFWFELPVARGAEGLPDALAPVAAPATGPRLTGVQVLVVDDSAMNRDLVARALKQEGAKATLAADGQQAVQLLRSRPEAFDAVLMDVQMPVMDGLTATRLIRGELGLTALPIVAFTAGVRADQQAAARAAGANAVLAKPMDLDEMALQLAAWVRPGPAAGTPVQAPAPTADTGAAPDAFPEIAGIDRARAARRLGNDRAMFLDLLRLFVADQGDAVAQARHALARGDGDAAARRMHTLRSNAGFLGALDLMASAEALELAIEKGRSDLDGDLDDLARQIAEIVAGSAPWR